MQANSRPVTSPQPDVHPRLVETVLRHRAQPFRKPVAEHTATAYAAARRAWGGCTPLILDTGCGVGLSSLTLAERHPDHFVIGVDQSLDRLSRGKPQPLPANCMLVRADLVDFWRLLLDDGVRLAQHWMLYPNPWPKPAHLQRRWHGHALFPELPRLGGVLELRTNWETYAREHALALSVLTGEAPDVERWQPDACLTPFERKYRDSGHALWRVRADLTGCAAAPR
ncbi:tRNA (guanine(46)-N(7))-methyltransferase TrmB [Crenobacter luteus]|uniref:tRNA (guanine(46)-N(7))-methyltransferase n=1 Tax=Crenobacter luteus TaxID=1452487 RepID=A0A165F657_9NEIS|nr:SAM-dependent methyltransferase [Crenobacter luteus]KZE31654.1 SAM-dependent methyltransferase [Crenobacter luteus]